MDNPEVKTSNSCNTENMHKSAIIYRNESASFIYVCYHCGRMFSEINQTLQHIESHFKLVDVLLDKFNEEDQDSFIIGSAPETVDVKVEIFDEINIDHKSRNSQPVTKYENKDLWKGNEIVQEKSNKVSTDVLSDGIKSPDKPATERSYQCHKCSRVFKNMSLLRIHMKVHTNDELLQISKCKKCECYYKNAFMLRIHVLEKHLITKRFSCNACAEQFHISQAKQFEEHLQQHNEPRKKLWSDIRDGIYHQENDLSKYEETYVFTEEQFPCEFCTQRFFIKSNLEIHTKSVHSGQRRMQCGQCYAIFTTPKYYFAHQLEHQRVGPIIHEHDDNVLLANLDACIDERIIYNEQSYSCLICNITFDAFYDIRTHIRKKHIYKMFTPPLERKKEFICDLCGMLFKSKFAVKKHLLIHSNTKSHACSICGKMFRLSSTRKIHERQHTGEKPFQCDECGRAFISKGLLTAHRKSHDDTTYPCHICGKTFNLPAGYRNHVKTHSQERSFKCTICTKSFNTRIYLTRHMAIHSDKEYQCNFCESKFNTSAGKRQHQRHKHRNVSK